MSSIPAPPPIKNFNGLIEPYLNGGKLLSHESKYFTAPGDNYGSTIFKVVAHIRKADGTEHDLHLVAKMLPENELYLQMFHPERTFRTEMNCYTIVAPAFIKLQKEAEIPDDEITNVFANCYGGRISLLENADKVDSGAALLLENLDTAGYKMGDRLVGFDYETTLVVVRDLARFHALAVGYRQKYPVEFEKTFMPFLQPFFVDNTVPDEMRSNIIQDNLSIMKSLPEMNDELFEKIMLAYSVYDDRLNNLKPCQDSPFSAIAHNDFWTNNMLIRYDDAGQPKDIKIVDFQVASYDSIVHDVLFFLVLSVHIDIVKTKFHELLNEYYNQFVGWLKRLGCNTHEYSYEKFDRELHRVAILQFPHIVVMHKVLSMRRDDFPNADKMDDKLLLDRSRFVDNFYDKLNYFIKLFDNNNFFLSVNSKE